MPSKNNRLRQQAAAAAATSPALPATVRLLGWISLAWLAAVIYWYWNRFDWLANLPFPPALANTPTDWSVFWQDGKALFLLVTLAAGMSAAGSYLLRAFRLPWLSPLEEWVFSLGMGLGVTGYLILGLGVLQLYRAPVFWGLWAAGIVLAWRRWFQENPRAVFEHLAQRINRWHTGHLAWWPLWTMLWIIIAMGCLMAFVPEIFYDAMVYHLGVPKWFLYEGGIKYYPSIHAQFPFLRQMLNVLGLALDGERLPKLLHWSSAPLIIATYHVLSRRYSYPKTTLLAALAFFSMPMVNLNLWTSGMDVGLTAYALLAFLAWINGFTTPASRTRWFSLAGVFGGFCFSSKYPGLIVVAVLCLVTFLWIGVFEKDWRGAVRAGLIIGGISVAVTVPWLMKEWWVSGNPMYPYLSHLFPSRDLIPDRLADFVADTQTGAKHDILGLLRTPWTATFAEVSSFTAPGVFLLGMLGFLLTGVVRKDLRKPWYSASCLFFLLYWLCVNAMTDRMRLGFPGIAIGCFLMAHTAALLYAKGGRPFRLALAATAAVATFTGMLSTYPTLLNAYAPWDVLAGRESAEQYLSYTHPGMDPLPATAMLSYAKTVMTPGHRLLIVGDEKGSLSPVPFLASGVHNDQIIVQWSRGAKTVDDLVARFKQNNVSHMLVNVHEGMRLSPYRIFNWDPLSLALYSAFADQHLRLIHQNIVQEHFFRETSPLLLYEFSEQPFTTPPSENILLEIYEEIRGHANEPLFLTKRRELLEAMNQAYPGVPSLQRKLIYWRTQELHAGHSF